MLIDRHQLRQVVVYSDAGENLPEADANAFLAIAYNEASASARVQFIEMLGGRSGPRAPFQVVDFPAPFQHRRGLPPIRRGPLVLILVLGKDEEDPNLWIDPDNHVADPGTPNSEEWTVFFSALSTWDTDGIVGKMSAREPRDPRVDGDQAPVVAVVEQAAPTPSWRRYAPLVAGGVVASLGLVFYVRRSS